MEPRLVAKGGKLSRHPSLWVQYAIDDEAWHPRTYLQGIQEFDPDAHNKEQEEAYGPDDLR